MDFPPQSVTAVLEQAEARLRAGADAPNRVWATGFGILDRNLGGGFRSGDLVLLAGAQGLGKTAWALQAARNVARSGRSVLVCSYEHDPQSLLVRLVALEAGLIAGPEAPGLARVRAAFETSEDHSGTVGDRLADTAGGTEALRLVQDYADRLLLHRSTGSSTTLDVIAKAVEQVGTETGQLPLLVVDYLQKVKVPGGGEEEDRATIVVEGLKDLAIDLDIPVLAIAAADKEALASGKRMRVNHLRGSSALAYEADIVLILNNKFDVVARHHLVYNVGNADRYKRWAVLSIEKNRSGKDGIDLEFEKRFDHGRFEPQGQMVTEQLVDERVFVE